MNLGQPGPFGLPRYGHRRASRGLREGDTYPHFGATYPGGRAMEFTAKGIPTPLRAIIAEVGRPSVVRGGVGPW